MSPLSKGQSLKLAPVSLAAFAVAEGNLPSAKASAPRIFKAVGSSFALLCYDGTVSEAAFLGRNSRDNHAIHKLQCNDR